MVMPAAFVKGDKRNGVERRPVDWDSAASRCRDRIYHLMNLLMPLIEEMHVHLG